MDITQRYITKISRAAQRYASRALKKSGIGPAEYECLHIVRKNEGVNQEQLSEMLNVDKAAVTRMVHSLVKKGYAVRQQDTEDRRSNKIYSTEKALDVKFDETSAESLFYEWLLEEIQPDELNAFLTVLDRLYIKSKKERVENFRNVQDWVSQREKQKIY